MAKFPDFTAQFCDSLICTGEIQIPRESFTSLRKFSETKKRDPISCGVQFKGENGWIHLYVTLQKTRKAGVLFVLRMHTYTPSEGEKEILAPNLEDLLKALGKISKDATLHISGSFAFPKKRFKPGIMFPEPAGLSIPLPPDLPIKVTGIRFRFETGVLESLIFDVTDEDEISVAPHLNMTTRMSERLPEECLNHIGSIARKLVLETQ